MSLISLATRTVLRQLLLGRTWAGDLVVDQPLDPIAEVMRHATGKPAPVIAIYTAEAKGEPCGLETQGGPQAIKMMVYVYLPPSRIDLPDGVSLEIDNVGSALALNIMGRQVDAAMHFGNTDWIALWRKFVTRIAEKTSRFILVQIEQGVPIPCLEIQYELTCVADADFGKPIYGGWLKLDALLRAKGTEGADLADLIKGLIEGPQGLPDYEQFQVNFGLSASAVDAIGIAPVLGSADDDGNVPPLNEVTGDPEITVVGPSEVP
ncbi:hypothetical protein [Mesorhizobium sp. ANAO-SY3R2]|uniref:hypothetical protein n=1 Tax=Mesorhizobium sp. ANAO-SY3R2 TaxID=3166644 RepID=UPI0036721A89